MATPQLGILADVPGFSRYLEFGAIPDTDAKPALRDLACQDLGEGLVIGMGIGLVQNLGVTIDGLRPFPSLAGPGAEVPSTQADLWVWVRGTDRGHIAHRGRAVEQALVGTFRRHRLVDGFTYDIGRDLSGYIDGTENPQGENAEAAGIVAGAGDGLDGGSFVATQQWVHDLGHFESLEQDDRDNIIGRRASDNEELDDAPASAHVKRTAQESFTPEAFIVRRSMPWADSSGEGLMFVAFGKNLDAFEVQLRRMTGEDDGIVDGLFRFSRPISGSYFWCPPVTDGHLDISALGL
ncbi:MAG: Dyp-type peroxidase [Alphaproteobacteria bacterium]|nr:Dyp-type peroxidase [Alphaproteobacteria bacterium]